ncbi:MAG: U32 family peptidase [Clostridia bacterium]|nr:U32 family peptidase [Clostridia bacterium]
MSKLELLAPAGDMEKLETAFYFGADACYFAGKKWGLRAFSENFDNDSLAYYINYAHKLGKKAYITVNIQAHNSDFEGLEDYIHHLAKSGADALIVSDAGVMSLIKQVEPNMAIHLSTQACASNKYSAKFWADAGAKRIILARELSLTEIKEIRDYLPPEVELEAFVHGAMCISYSGRCLLSNYLTGRDSNRGQCVQACRWEYFITERSRLGQGEEYEIQQDDRSTYILNSKDLCMINYLDKMADAGVTSFKIEGRMKSAYYVANVVNVYRRALDEYEKNPAKFKADPARIVELEKCSHRRFTTGFCLGENDREYSESSTPVSTSTFIGIVKRVKGGYCFVEQRNRFKVGDKLEILSPTDTFNKTFIVEEMYNEAGERMDDANKVQEVIKLKVPYKLTPNDLLRMDKKE